MTSNRSEVDTEGSSGIAAAHENTDKRSPQLDIIRAFAILAVIGSHMPSHVPHAAGAIGIISRAWSDYGGFGVPLFFTLSGYLVGGIIISEYLKQGSFDITRFLIRRGLKIYPAYYAFIAYVFTMPLLKHVRTLPEQLVAFWPNLLFLQNYVGPNPAGHTWSLAVEEQFYLLLPLVLWVLFRSGRRQWISPLCLFTPLAWTLLRMVSALLGDPYIQTAPGPMAATHLCVDGLVAGVGLRAAAHFHSDRFEAARAWRMPLLVAGLVLLAATRLDWQQLSGVSLMRILPLTQVAALLLVYSLHQLRLPESIAQPLAWVGRYSYSIYLWHVTIMGICTHALMPRLPMNDLTWRWLIGASVVTLSCVLFGALFAKLVEYPILQWRNRAFPSKA